MGHRVVLPVGQADLEDQSLRRDVRERRSDPDRGRADRLSAVAPRARSLQKHASKPARLRQGHPGNSHGATIDSRTATNTVAADARTATSSVRVRGVRNPGGSTPPRQSRLRRNREGGMNAQTVPDTRGTSPGIHVLTVCNKKYVDGRDNKPGHDDYREETNG